MKPKKCKICKESFDPQRPLQMVCSVKCSYEYSKAQKQKQLAKQKQQQRKSDSEKRIDLMSKDAYRSKILQPLFNKIARLIDYGQPCIATGTYGKMSGGHYISVGANRTICMNLHNIHVQSFHSNSEKSGDTLKYQIGITQIYGKDYLEFMNSLHQTPKLDLSKQEMIELKSKCLSIIKELNSDLRILNALERIKLRNEINTRLGIYDLKYGVYNG